VEPHGAQRGVQLDGGRPRRPGRRVHTDATRLRQVLLNLLSNAIKYNHPGGRVRLRGRPADGTVCGIEVVDTGPGLTQQQQAAAVPGLRAAGRRPQRGGRHRHRPGAEQVAGRR
jgi:signal transduction histidine kinase